MQRGAYKTKSDTLVAIVTPHGEGGIGVIQVSGPEALEIVGKLFRGKRAEDVPGAPSGRLFYGTIQEHGQVIDEVILCVFRANDSPTGEDMVEVNCHGGIRAVRKTLEAIVSAGAREAGWVEILDRAATNRKIDLIQREVLEALPKARTRLCVKVLLWQYRGFLSRWPSAWESEIEEIILAVSGTNLNEPRGQTSHKLAKLLCKIHGLIDSSPFGLALCHPGKISITGAPNVGKSSLFNLLLREDRTIVHPEPGTTRDYVNEYLSIRGMPFELIDSAGIRQTQCQVEQMGVERAMALNRHADKILLVLDNSRPLCPEERELIHNLEPERILPVVNKIDLDARLDARELEALFVHPPCFISALKCTGLEALEETLVKEFLEEINNNHPRTVVFTRRQHLALTLLRDATKEAITAMEDTGPGHEFVDSLKAIGIRLRQMLYGCETPHSLSKAH